MKEQLEIKHLAPYLPHEVIYEVQIRDLHPEAPEELRRITLKPDTIGLCLTNGILLLHPLSRLTEEREFGGERFVPAERLLDYLNGEFGYGIPDYNAFKETLISIKIEHQPYCIAEKLFEWHFDVFGLINKGLAKEI